MNQDAGQQGAGGRAPHRQFPVGRIVVTALCVIAALILLTQSLYVVGEAEQAVVSRFGVIRDIVVAPDNDFHERYPNLYDDKRISLDSINVKHSTGLMFKVPFVDKVEKISDRLFTYVSDSEVVNTARKNSITSPPTRSTRSPTRRCTRSRFPTRAGPSSTWTT